LIEIEIFKHSHRNRQTFRRSLRLAVSYSTSCIPYDRDTRSRLCPFLNTSCRVSPNRLSSHCWTICIIQMVRCPKFA
jgi:hypothetical protein